MPFDRGRAIEECRPLLEDWARDMAVSRGIDTKIAFIHAWESGDIACVTAASERPEGGLYTNTIKIMDHHYGTDNPARREDKAA